MRKRIRHGSHVRLPSVARAFLQRLHLPRSSANARCLARYFFHSARFSADAIVLALLIYCPRSLINHRAICQRGQYD